jgi:hypothetical protein
VREKTKSRRAILGGERRKQLARLARKIVGRSKSSSLWPKLTLGRSKTLPERSTSGAWGSVGEGEKKNKGSNHRFLL